MDARVSFCELWFGVATLCSAQVEVSAKGSCRYFKRDDQTIFLVMTRDNEKAAHFYQIEAGSQDRYRDSWSNAVVDAGALVTPRGQWSSDGIQFTAKPWPPSDRVSIRVKNWPAKNNTDGDYEPIDSHEVERLAQTHFDQADKALNETYQSVLQRLPKPGVETLRTFERDRISIRDGHAAALPLTAGTSGPAQCRPNRAISTKIQASKLQVTMFLPG